MFWDLIRKISEKTKSPSYTHVNRVGTDSKATSKTDNADTLGEFFLSQLIIQVPLILPED